MKKMKKQLKEETIKNVEKKLIQYQTEIRKIEERRNKIKFRVDKCKINLKHQVQQIKDIKEQINNNNKNIEVKQKKISDHATHVQELNKKHSRDLLEINSIIQFINLKNAADYEGNNELEKNIHTLKSQLKKHQLKNQQCEIRTNAMKKKLKEDLTSTEPPQKVYEKQMIQLTTLEREYEKVADEHFDETEKLSNHNRLSSYKVDLLNKIQDLSSIVLAFELNNPNLFFRYTTPRPYFDRRNVHGLVCKLFKVIDFKFELALTTLAGRKLYFIVVEDDTTCKEILETNIFPNRINFILLNAINSNSLTPNVIRIAQQIGGADQVFPAMSLIKYDEKYFKAIQWVFGQSFVCTTKEIAKKVCFDNRVKKHCYTLEGDHFSPYGGISSGASTQRLVLKEIADQDVNKFLLQEKRSELTRINNILATITYSRDRIKKLNNRKLALEVQIECIQSKLHSKEPDQQVTIVNKIKKEIAELENKLDEGKFNEKQLKSIIVDLENKFNNSSKIFEEKIHEANTIRENIYENIENTILEVNKIRDHYTLLEHQLKDSQSRKQDYEHRLAVAETKKNRLEEELILNMTEFDDADIIYKKAYKDYIDQKEKLMTMKK